MPGVLGTLQALEAIKVVSGLGDANGGRLLTFDATADPKRAFRCVALRERDERCVACGDESAGVLGAPRGAAIASYDYDAFVGQGAACERTFVKPSQTRDASLDVALPAALDDAAAAAARNVARYRGDGGAPWATDDQLELVRSRGEGTRTTASADSRDDELRRVETPVPPLDAAAKPPLHARAEADGRLTPSSLFAATRALGDAAVVLDVRPKHLSDAARLRGALAIPLRELDGRRFGAVSDAALRRQNECSRTARGPCAARRLDCAEHSHVGGPCAAEVHSRESYAASVGVCTRRTSKFSITTSKLSTVPRMTGFTATPSTLLVTHATKETRDARCKKRVRARRERPNTRGWMSGGRKNAGSATCGGACGRG